MARLWQLADDPETYGADAGLWMVVSDDGETELAGPMSLTEAERRLARVNITPGTSTLYRVWLNDREVCATNSGSLAMWALLEAKRFATRALPANDSDDLTPPPGAAALSIPHEMEAA